MDLVVTQNWPCIGRPNGDWLGNGLGGTAGLATVGGHGRGVSGGVHLRKCCYRLVEALTSILMPYPYRYFGISGGCCAATYVCDKHEKESCFYAYIVKA